MSWFSRLRAPLEVAREIKASACGSVAVSNCDRFRLSRESGELWLSRLFFSRTNELFAVAFAGESFDALVDPVAVLVVAVLRCYGWEGFGDAGIELGFGVFVAHGRCCLGQC